MSELWSTSLDIRKAPEFLVKKTRRQFYSNRLTEFQLEQNQPAVKRPLTEVRGACPRGQPGRTVRRPSEIDTTLSVTLQASRHQI